MNQALDQSIGFALFTGAIEQRRTSMSDYRLEQVADYPCIIELAMLSSTRQGS